MSKQGKRTDPAGGWQPTAVAAAAVVVYLNALRNAFVWDDQHLIVGNPAIKSWERLPSLFGADLFTGSVLSQYYRPLQAATYLVDYQLWGLNPLGFHLTNLLLHAVVSVLFFFFAARLAGERRSALAAALLFAVHPVHTEAVTYVAGRSDPLSAVFLLTALLLGVARPDGHPLRPPLAGALIRTALLCAAAFFLALLAREAAMILPLLWLLSVAFVQGRADAARQDALSSAPRVALFLSGMLAALAGYLAIRAAAVGLQAVAGAPAQVDLAHRLMTLPRVVLEYLVIWLVPVDLHMERTVRVAESLLEPATLLCTGLVAGLVALAIRWRREAPLVAFGVAWFFVALLPVSNLVPLSTFVAEHWLYVPSMGLFLAAGWGCGRLWDLGWQQPVATALVVLVAVYGGLTMRRNLDWRDEQTLYAATVALAPTSARAWTNLGHAHQQAGRLDQARAAYERALALLEGPAAGATEDASAAQAYEAARRFDSDAADAHNNLGNVYRSWGQLEAAEREFRRALEINPRHVAAHNNLALTFDALGRGDEARAEFETALRIDPEHATTHSNLGNYYFRRDRLQEAREHYLAAIRLNPDYAEAYNNLGSVQFRLGDAAAAENAYRRALRLRPDLAEVRRNLDIVLRSRVPQKE